MLGFNQKIGKWGPVCDPWNHFRDKDGVVACLGLGYNSMVKRGNAYEFYNDVSDYCEKYG